jgi:hypothetical protein
VSELFEKIPRWQGAPPICEATNRLAFKSKADWEDFHSTNSPRCKVDKIWLCSICHHWHVITKAPNPTGDSSGTGRNTK